MTAAAKRPRTPLLLFSLLYFVQGGAMAYFSNFQKPYLKGLGIDADTIALLTAALLAPFVLKIAFGAASDNLRPGRWGRRKPFMVAGLVLAGGGFAACSAFLPDTSFPGFCVAIVTASFGVALFDAATDGFAIDETDPADSGLVQGFMVGGRALGIILLSLVFGEISQSLGFRGVFISIAAIMAIPLVLVLRLPTVPAAARSTENAPMARGVRRLDRVALMLFCIYAASYSFTAFGIDGLIPFYLNQEHGLAESALGRFGATRGLGAVAGALAFTLLFRRVGLRGSSQIALAGLAIGGIACYGLLGPTNYLAIALGWGLVWGIQETCFVTLAMEESRHRLSGTLFASYMAVANLGTAIGEGVATGLTDDTTFGNIFLILSGAVVIPIFVLQALDLYRRKRKGPSPAP